MKKLLYVILPLSVLMSCNKEELETSSSRFNTGIDDFEIPDPNYDPDRPGPFQTCFQEHGSDSSKINFNIYYPTANRVCSPARNLNLVAIHQAYGTKVSSYSSLAEHIASHGFVVMIVPTICYDISTYTECGEKIKNHLDYLYNDDFWKGKVNPNISIIGHSHGGNVVGTLGDKIYSKYGMVKSMIMMAPNLNFQNQFAPIENYAESFLGMTVYNDSDFSTNGFTKQEGKPWPIAMGIYDKINLGKNSISKDFVFGIQVEYNKPIDNQETLEYHHFHKSHFARGYITAHLHWKLNGYQDYIKYFKYQAALPNKPVNDQYTIQHAEPYTKVLHNFEESTKDEHLLGGKVEYFGNIGFPHIGITYLDDPQSPHHTNALTFFHFKEKDNPLSYIRFYLEKDKNLKTYKYLSFRITQVYNPALNNAGIDKDVQILFSSGNKTASVKLSQFGGHLQFPKKFIHNGIDLTQNIMRTYVIPLDEFIGIDFSNLDLLTFNFTDEPGTIYTLDDIEFIQ